MSFIEIFNNIITNFWESFLMMLSFCYITGKRDFVRNNILKAIVFVIFNSAFLYIAYILFPEYTSIFDFVFVFLVISILTHTSFFTSLLSMALVFIFFFVVDFASISLLSLMFRVSIFRYIQSDFNRFLAILLAKGIESIILFFLYRKMPKNDTFNKFNKENSPFSIMIIQGLIFILIIATAFLLVQTNKFTYLNQMFLLLISFLYLVFIFVEYKEKEEISKIKSKFLLQEQYVKNMELVIDAIRKEKHDFANHINTLLAMCLLNDQGAFDKISEYAKKLISNSGSTYKFYNTGNNFIDGLLAVKSNYAAQNNIHLDIDFEAPLDAIDVDDTDLTSIMGNILDNAFDVLVSMYKEGHGIVSIYTYFDNDKYYISISNNGPMISDQDIKKIFNKYFSSKSRNKNDRGFGLFIVKQLVDKNNGNISVNSTEDNTEFLIEFNLKKMANANTSLASSQ